MPLNFFKKKKQPPQDLKEVLAEFESLQNNFDDLVLQFEKLRKENSFSIQKTAMIRFNPFSEIGGNQSFSLALLDHNDSGFVITSFYTKEGSRVYGKPIQNGTSSFALSREEIKAVEQAKNKLQDDSLSVRQKKTKQP